ncbi:hypothetical protein EHI8A_029850 [Entamoeba histolytica HM-1:IMSS-B]|uniref:Uncharacterized protein n=5 Tax=Entamoeba histolytica TaxID=5759 RepID=C4LSY5_ENTH1|nr:hypothetical protein EHI_148150 [Entamoeba histolytica HM-1:IMSS]EMH75111.1 hypothetical protein EHI8A_029850 [Entamoeba histolytica HM-1:IMSS-B]EMS17673.1 hypothetical protein KM1_058940 [Entamoeba histolytica HM-3:IMSS]ENY60526.1 hypothetical protein EHI7A_027700 [Entamoeba histolytica HM-1:IMSS-A]GAT91653.1 hypothetical protein CL6EHI_148150 [Entamoeba histolytica]EAL52142.1 hypothetical protein EHI_148150 [Entamoeba histolytica HM-1:IMSS]|eukprot:XP_657527.1 hypothetical protein EHI_148150 [Entamoeba histolytica HM-1:IMSS]
MEEEKPKKHSVDERKRRTVDWLGDRLVEKIDRDHYMCIICFKRMSRGYACCHCIEEHQDITDELKPYVVKAYTNGKKINDELMDMREEELEKEKRKQAEKAEKNLPETETTVTGQPPINKDNKTKKSKSTKMSPELKRRLEKLENEGKAKWEMKPKKEIEKQRTSEGKRVTSEISKIMASNGIPFAKSDAIWKIVTEVINSTTELGPQVLEKIRFSARTLKRRYDEAYLSQNKPTQLQPSSSNTDQLQETTTPAQVTQQVFHSRQMVIQPIVQERQMSEAVVPPVSNTDLS